MHPLVTNYIFFSIFLLVLLLYRNFNYRRKKAETIFFVLSYFALMLLHVGVAPNSVDDLPNYQDDFLMFGRADWWQIFDVHRFQEYFWSIFNKCISCISSDFTLLLLIYNLIFVGAFYIFFEKYSLYAPMSVVIFLLSSAQSLIVLRQYLAISILLLSVPCILQKKMLPYLLLCTLAYFTHHSSIIWLPMYFLYNISNKRLFVAMMILMSVVVAFLGSNIFVVVDYLHLNKYDAYIVQDTFGLSLFKIIEPLFFFVPYVLLLKKRVLDEGMNKLCFIALLLVTVGYLFPPPMEQTSRMLQYFATMKVIAVPLIFKSFKVKFFGFLYISALIMLYGYMFYRGVQQPYFSHYSYIGISILYWAVMAFSCWILLKIIRKGRLKNHVLLT